MKIQICWTPKPGSFWFCFSMCAVCGGGSACSSIYPACRQKGARKRQMLNGEG